MIDTLKSSGSGLTFKSLSDRIAVKVQSKFRDQNPMLLGQDDTRFIFGSERASVQYAVTVGRVEKDQKQVTLNAGMAQGLRSGTRLAIYPLNTINFTDKQNRIAIVEVTEEIQASSASAKVLEVEESGIGLKGEIQEGAPAVILSVPPDLVRRVRLLGEKKLGNRDNELPTQQLVDAQQGALAAVRQALKENGWVVEVEEGEHYQVAVGKEGEYEICTGMPLKNLKPPMIDDPDAPKRVVERLLHLAKYQAVQELDNSNSELKDSLEFELCDLNKQPLPNGGKNSIQSHNERVHLRVKNISHQPLNIAVLDLAPDWAISQFPVLGQEGQFFQLVNGQEIFIGKIRLVIPDGKGYEQGASETFKLFATRGPADFRFLKLPPIDQSIAKKGTGEATRGLASPLAKLLEAVGGDPDTAPSMTRAVLEPDPSAEFVTKQIQFTIKH